MKRHPPDGTIPRARRLRRDMTDSERAMWNLLRQAFPDWHFRRQSPIRHYIVDFVSHRAKLVIEVDGGQHNDEADAARTAIIEAEGYRVLRFWNHDVLGNPDGVWSILDRALHEPHPTPTPPHQGEGQKRRRPKSPPP
jgi:very-short-patch-repair endonuclease